MPIVIREICNCYNNKKKQERQQQKQPKQCCRAVVVVGRADSAINIIWWSRHHTHTNVLVYVRMYMCVRVPRTSEWVVMYVAKCVFIN